jgi:FKBP-type peptidyl-prolyl cis-trans isomerase
MKKKSINTWIAIAAALVVVGFLLYGNVFVNLFNNANQNPEPTMPPSTPTTGVVIKDTVVGTGAVAEPGDSITVNYVGTLTDGTVFDSSVSRNQPFTFTLGAGQVIRGWEEGLVGMKVGGTRELTIAPDYAYGDQVIGPIPANSTLIFQVQLLNVAPGQAPAANSNQ